MKKCRSKNCKNEILTKHWYCSIECACYDDAFDVRYGFTGRSIAKEQRRLFHCINCNKKTQFQNVIYVQTYWYTPPSGCTDGDYWSQGEVNIICPKCKILNRLLSDRVKEKYLDNVSGFSNKIIYYKKHYTGYKGTYYNERYGGKGEIFKFLGVDLTNLKSMNMK
jgi:hypothetical protein